jgi:hypothetical protein
MRAIHPKRIERVQAGGTTRFMRCNEIQLWLSSTHQRLHSV